MEDVDVTMDYNYDFGNLGDGFESDSHLHRICLSALPVLQNFLLCHSRLLGIRVNIHEQDLDCKRVSFDFSYSFISMKEAIDSHPS